MLWSVGDKLLTGAVSLSARRHIWLSTSPTALRKLSPHVHVQGILASKTRQNIRLTMNRKEEVRTEVVWVRCYVAIGRSVDDSVYRQFAPCTCSTALSGQSDFLRDTFANKTLGNAIIYWMAVGFNQKVYVYKSLHEVAVLVQCSPAEQQVHHRAPSALPPRSYQPRNLDPLPTLV